MVAGVHRRESYYHVETGRSHQGPQSLEAGYDLIAFVAADQGGRNPAAPTEFCLRYARPTSGFDQQIAAYHAFQFKAKYVLAVAVPPEFPIGEPATVCQTDATRFRFDRP